jgi:hypothetical protein
MSTNTLEVHDGIVGALVRRGLPIDYAQRAAAELADHHGDLVGELRAAGMDESSATADASRRLGDTRRLVKKTVREYQRRFWCGRWRLTTFLFAPIPLLVLAWIGTALVAGVCLVLPLYLIGVKLSGPPDGIVSMGDYAGVYLAQALYYFIAPTLVMLLLARQAKRAALGWRWVAVSACVVACSACIIKCGFPMPELNHRYLDGTPVPADRFLITATLVAPGLSEVCWAWYRDQFGRILLPFAVAAVFLIRNRQLALRSERLVHDGC